jgi:hypothetical protein
MRYTSIRTIRLPSRWRAESGKRSTSRQGALFRLISRSRRSTVDEKRRAALENRGARSLSLSSVPRFPR